MPELPEVQSIGSFLAPRLVGKRLQQLSVNHPPSFRGEKKSIEGMTVSDISRYGKILHVHLTTTHGITRTATLNIHLKMSGQISMLPSLHTRVVLHFENMSLFFNDARKFGWMQISPTPITPKGKDLLDDKALDYLKYKLQKIKKPIKQALLDQDVVAGIGNIYANDILWQAQIHPLTRSSSLSAKAISKLQHAITTIISEAIKRKGSSKTWVYRLPDGTKGHYQDNFKVYDRENKPCKRCHSLIQKFFLAGRSTYYCPRCQKIQD